MSTTGTKTGCMKWYTFNDSNESSTVNIILDHNITTQVDWEMDSSAVYSALQDDTSTWNEDLNPRLIEVSEILKITNNDWFNPEISSTDSWFVLEDNSQNASTLEQETATYKWLFDYTYQCTVYGCSVNDDTTFGYWTATIVPGSVHNRGWRINYYGHLSNYDDILESDLGGIRPVITISKSSLQ